MDTSGISLLLHPAHVEESHVPQPLLIESPDLTPEDFSKGIKALQHIADNEASSLNLLEMSAAAAAVKSAVHYGPDGVIISLPGQLPITLSPFMGQLATSTVKEEASITKIAGVVAIGCQAAGDNFAAWLFLVVASGDAAALPAAHSTSMVADALTKIGYIRNDFRECFERGSDLGEGAFGNVYTLRRKCSESQTDQLLAGKVARRNAPTELAREASFLVAAGSHPNVINFFGLYCTTQSWTMVLECCSGGDLKNYITNHGQFTEETALDLVGRGLFAALSHIHSRGIVHRDVKPENVLVDFLPDAVEPHRAVLIDFGIACRTRDQKELARRCGSAGSIAPEVLRQSLQSPKADVFCGAVALYFAMGGKMPFRGPDLMATLRANARAHIRFGTSFEEVSEFSKDMLRVFLHTDPSRRPSSSQAFGHLTQLLAVLRSGSASSLHSLRAPLDRRSQQNSSTSTESASAELQSASNAPTQHVLSKITASTAAAAALTISAPASPKPQRQHLRRAQFQKQQTEAQILQRKEESRVLSSASLATCDAGSDENSSSSTTTSDTLTESTSTHALNQ